MLKKRFLSVLLCCCLAVGLMPTLTLSAQAYATGDDYPSEYKNPPIDTVIDRWNFYNRECTSFVAWCLNSRNNIGFHNYYLGPRWGHAKDWGAAARNVGIMVDNTPAVGAVAWFGAKEHGAYGYGHVAWVSALDGDYVWIEEYNWNPPAAFNARRIHKSAVSGYIHVADIGSTTPSQPTVTFSAWNRDGTTYIRDTDASIGQMIKASGGQCTSTGMYLYNADGGYLAEGKNNFYDVSGISYFKINEECGYTLTPGTTYRYKFYADVGGKRYWSDMGSFTTTGAAVQNLGNDFYATIYYPKGGKLLESSGGDGITLTNVQLNDQYYANADSTDPKCIWHFIRHNDDGSYKIVNEYCGWCLDVHGGIAENEANVATWYVDHGGRSERWFITKALGSDSWYSLTSALNYPSYAVDVYFAGTAAGTNVQLYSRDEYAGNQAQQFNIVKQNYSRPSRPSAPARLSSYAVSGKATVEWNNVPPVSTYDRREYIVNIYDYANQRYIVSGEHTSNTSYTHDLPAGTYRAEVQAVNTKYLNCTSSWSTIDMPVFENYKVSVAPSIAAGGTATGGGTYQNGKSVTVTAAASPGYIFKGWTENGATVSTSASYTFTAGRNRTLIAVFEKDSSAAETFSVRVSASPSAGGTVSGGGTYQAGTSAVLRAVPSSGYRFVEWRLNGRRVSSSASYTFTVSEDQTYTAVFEKQIDTMHGRVTVDALFTPYSPAGELVTLRVIPDAGYQLNSIRVVGPNGRTVALTGGGNTYTFLMPSFDVSVYVDYVKK